LVPGDPAALHAHAAALTSRGDSLIHTGTSLKRIDATEAWSGRAAEAFQEKFALHPNQWLTAGDAHQDAAAAVSGYAETLRWAQGQAGTAAHQWDEAQTATEAALNQYNTNAAAGVRQAPFVDPGAAARENAQATLDRARAQLAGAGETTARTVSSVTRAAPTPPARIRVLPTTPRPPEQGFSDWVRWKKASRVPASLSRGLAVKQSAG
jgi:hypothetical protein